MSNVQIYAKTGLPEAVAEKLSPEERRLAKIAIHHPEENPRMVDQNVAQWTTLIESILLKTQIKLGLQPRTNQENKALMIMLNEDLKKFKNLTRLEVYAALDAGLDGDFLKNKDEDRVFFNPSNFVQWIKAWIEHVRKPAMTKIHNAQMSLPSPVQEKTEKELTISQYQIFVRATFDYIELNRPFIDVGGYIYGFLRKMNLIEEVTKEEFEATVLSELQIAKVERDKSKTKVYDQILASIATLESIEDNSAFPAASRNAVMRKIREIASWEEADIEDYFEFIKETMKEYFNNNQL